MLRRHDLFFSQPQKPLLHDSSQKLHNPDPAHLNCKPCCSLWDIFLSFDDSRRHQGRHGNPVVSYSSAQQDVEEMVSHSPCYHRGTKACEWFHAGRLLAPTQTMFA